MCPNAPVSILPCKDERDRAERELAAFFAAVEILFGEEQAKLSAEDWLNAIELVIRPDQPTGREWRSATIIASSRLAHRPAVAGYASCLAPGDSTENIETRS